ncbi:YqjK family protein [Propionivibrio sp.]|uniref:YqjK family protein n=1 Tax=Propionivibrio sp. TaxID=2212460 RepID=UPI0039E71F4F
MNRRLDDLLLQRGRLLERIAGQRDALRRDFAPLAAALGKIDVAVAGVRAGVNYLRRHALAASAVAGAFMLFKGKAALRWGARAFSLWKSWRVLQSTLLNLSGRSR